MRSCSPQHYELFFEPNLSSFTFTGREKVQVHAEKPIRVMVLHAAELTVSAASVIWNEKTIPAKITLKEKKEELELTLPEPVSGDFTLYLEFAGTLNDRLIGFYRSEYQQNGKKKIMLSTQFEAADARRAFPCWDEPDAKARFTVSLLVNKGLTALSNMPATTKSMGKKTLFTFETSPVMSTYLLYLGVGEFDSVESSLGNVKVRIITTKGKKSQAAYALEMTKTFLKYYQDYFGIPYPLPKLDMIAVPDFASGAMENWGAITFRETALLFDQKTSSLATKQRVAEVIAHELAHQWFGNLVTMKWWNNLWLNESFATFMATKAVDAVYPEWEYWDQFVGGAVSQAFDLDALKSSHPIEVDVKDPSEIREIFDEISYQKGGSVLRMLEHFLGADAFRTGLSSYLSIHQYANATTSDLWDALEKSSGQPIKKLMNTWVKVTGYPILDVVMKNGVLHLNQRRFLLEGRVPSRTTWMIPLSLQSKDGLVRHIMDKKTFSLPLAENWCKVNASQTGLYRVSYQQNQLNALTRLFSQKTLSKYDRWGIHEDYFAQCMAGERDVEDYFNFVAAYGNEDDFIVVDNIAQSLYTTYLLFYGTPIEKRAKERSVWFFRRAFARLGWDAKPQEKPSDVLLRAFVLTALGRMDDESILAEARTRFEKFLVKPESLDPNLRGVVYTLAAWSGNEATFDQLVKLYKSAATQEESTRFLSALAGFQNTRLLQRALDFSLSKDVRSQDLPIVILRMAGNPCGKSLVWPWVQKNWQEICKRFGVGSPLINRVVGSLSVVADKKKEKEIVAFFKKYPMPGTERKLAQTLEILRINSAFRERARK